MTSAYSRQPHSSLYYSRPTDKDHDKYQYVHVITYSDETIMKHPYLNIDDVSLAFNQ